VIILTEPDAEGKVKVTTISHKHPESTPQRPTSWYGLPEHPITGEGTISVGKPKVIHYHQLKPASPPARMSHEYFALLLADIGKFERNLMTLGPSDRMSDENSL